MDFMDFLDAVMAFFVMLILGGVILFIGAFFYCAATGQLVDNTEKEELQLLQKKLDMIKSSGLQDKVVIQINTEKAEKQIDYRGTILAASLLNRR